MFTGLYKFIYREVVIRICNKRFNVLLQLYEAYYQLVTVFYRVSIIIIDCSQCLVICALIKQLIDNC